MHFLRRTGVAVALSAALLAAVPAHAGLRIGLGADYWVYQGGEFNLTFSADTPLVRRLHIGARFGAMIATVGGVQLGVPIDLLLRLNLGQLYFEGLVGPWVVFGGGFPIKAHAALGFGLQAPGVAFGLELGWLDPSPVAGIRLAWRI